MPQTDQLLYHIESRGNRITTYELMSLRISQYQRVLTELRKALALKGWTLTEAQKIEGQKGNFIYYLRKPNDQMVMLCNLK